ncbi:MAG: PilW family protein [Variovorax sp.]
MKTAALSRGVQRGFTLVEFLVALVIGMLIVLAAVASLFGTRSASLARDDVSELQQSSARAFQLLKQQITQAGYVPIDVPDGNRGYFRTNQTDQTNVDDEPVFFSIKGTEGGAGKSDTLKIGYAPAPDFFNDCLGRAAKYDATNPAAALNVRLITGEFSVDSAGNLRCKGSGGNGSSYPLISGVERFDVAYGVAGSAADPQIRQYVAADAVGEGAFNKVRAIRVCLQLVARSGANTAQSYIDCDGTKQTSTDGRQRGVFVSVFALRNNLGAL